MNKMCKVIVKNGMQLVTMPDGTEIPYIKMTRITQGSGQGAYGEALIKLVVHFEHDTKHEESVDLRTKESIGHDK